MEVRSVDYKRGEKKRGCVYRKIGKWENEECVTERGGNRNGRRKEEKKGVWLVVVPMHGMECHCDCRTLF